MRGPASRHADADRCCEQRQQLAGQRAADGAVAVRVQRHRRRQLGHLRHPGRLRLLRGRHDSPDRCGGRRGRSGSGRDADAARLPRGAGLRRGGQWLWDRRRPVAVADGPRHPDAQAPLCHGGGGGRRARERGAAQGHRVAVLADQRLDLVIRLLQQSRDGCFAGDQLAVRLCAGDGRGAGRGHGLVPGLRRRRRRAKRRRGR